MADVLAGMLPASFRGVPFFVSSRKQEGPTRKTVVHEFPFKNGRFIEDLGLSTRIFTIEAMIANNNNLYFSEKLALDTALATEGPGIYIDPWGGVFQVSLQDKSEVSESDTELNIARYTLVFGETVDDVFPGVGGDLTAKINAFSAPIRDIIKSRFTG